MCIGIVIRHILILLINISILLSEELSNYWYINIVIYTNSDTFEECLMSVKYLNITFDYSNNDIQSFIGEEITSYLNEIILYAYRLS